MTTTLPGARPGTHTPWASGEFHYFRVPRAAWADRLALCADAGFESVSIYVPWNWHVPSRGTVDFTGMISAERDLVGALETIGRSGLSCVFRPGPFITAEWRNGGLPQWLFETRPEIAACDATGRPATGGGYPAVTYRHPGYESEALVWLDAVLGVAHDFDVTRGGPVRYLQLDDEPSYFQKVVDPLALDYNSVLMDGGAGGEPSVFAQWVLDRHGGIDLANDMYGTDWRSPGDIRAPRVHMAERRQLPLYLDWLYFKLDEINRHVRFLYDASTERLPGVAVSMLYPYLQPLLAGHFARFARAEGLDLQLTNECYLSLMGMSRYGEGKVGAVVACHEVYNMWRGPTQGPAVTMELQASNDPCISPSTMELLYALTVARGIKGINYFMAVGGSNPAGFENDTGAYYDIEAPISLDGSERPHFATIAKTNAVMSALSDVVTTSRPLYDTWIGCYAGYEAAAMAGAAFHFDAWGHQILANMGDMGLADATSLPTLLSLSSVSYGCIDLEEASVESISPLPQMWVPCLDFLPQRIQDVLALYVEMGGHLIVLPVVPTLDEKAQPFGRLAEVAFGSNVVPGGPAFVGYGGGWDSCCVVNGRCGESLVLPGAATHLPLPDGAEVIATRSRDGKPCAFTRRAGEGRVTVLGFRLQYSPGADPAQHEFVVSLVEESCGPRHAWSDSTGIVAMQAATTDSGDEGGILCVVNPRDFPAEVHARYTPTGSAVEMDRSRIPLSLPSFSMARGARLLPVDIRIGSTVVLGHSTWELVGMAGPRGSGVIAKFHVPPSTAWDAVPVGELLLRTHTGTGSGNSPPTVRVHGGSVVHAMGMGGESLEVGSDGSVALGGSVVIAVQAHGPELHLVEGE